MFKLSVSPVVVASVGVSFLRSLGLMPVVV
jgi:hypothetical protein